jgi:hypothetical protein
MASLIATGGGGGDPFCLDSGAPAGGWVGWDGGMVWRAVSAGAGLRGQYANGAVSFSCAVCQGTSFTRWGTTTCPSGYSKLYDGYVGSIHGSWDAGWNAGSAICLHPSAGGAVSWVNWDSGMVIRGIGTSGNNRVSYQNQATITCAVCN